MKADVPGSNARIVRLDEGTEVCIVENQPLEELLFDRKLTGVKFRHACLLSTRLFLRHILEELADDPVAELMILSKGLVYQLGEAYALETGRNLPVNIAAATRAGVEGEAAKIDLPYTRLDAGCDRLAAVRGRWGGPHPGRRRRPRPGGTGAGMAGRARCRREDPRAFRAARSRA